MLQVKNTAITGLKIIAFGNKKKAQPFSSGTGGPEVFLNLVDNHFTVLETEHIDTSDNNSLYGALATALPNFMEQNVFRSELSKFIENNKNIHRDIRQSLYRSNTLGGGRFQKERTISRAYSM